MEITAPKEVDYNPSVTIITAKDIKDSGAISLSEAIKRVPGVMYNDNIGHFGTPSIRVRGHSDEKTGVYMDGIPVEDIYQKWGGFGHITTHGIGGIQVAKGFTSPVYGMTQMSGAVNIISAKPQKELEIGLSQKLIYGRSTPDVDEVRQGISVGTKQDKFYFQIDASHTQRSKYPFSYDYDLWNENPYAATHNNTVKLKLGVTPNENHEYSLNYINSKAQKNGFLMSDGRHLVWPVYDQRLLYLLGNSFFTPDFSLNTRVYFTELDRQSVAYTKNSPGGFVMMSGQNTYSNTMGSIFTFSYDIYKDANAKFGVNVKRDYHKSYDSTSTDKYADLYTSGFAQYSQRLWDFRLVAALNYDWAYTLNKEDIGTFAKGLAAQAALYYDFAEGHSAHFMIGRKHDIPTMWRRNFSYFGHAVPNPNLEQETAILYELGYDINLESTTFSIAVYYNDLTDMYSSEYLYGADATCAIPQTDRSGNTYCTRAINVPDGYLYGGEIGIEQGFFADDMLVLGANYTFTQKVEEDKVNDGKRITSYPNHMFNAKIALKPIKSLEFIALGTWDTARWYGDPIDGYTRDKPYIVLDLGARYYFDNGFAVSFDVPNVTDRDNTINGTHLVGRRYMVGVEYNY